MIQVRHLFEDDVETIALMPSIGDAVDWVRLAYLDPGFDDNSAWQPTFQGDLYAVDESGKRTYLLSSSNTSITAREAWLIHKLVAGWMSWDETAKQLHTEFGWGSDV